MEKRESANAQGGERGIKEPDERIFEDMHEAGDAWRGAIDKGIEKAFLYRGGKYVVQTKGGGQ